MSSSTFSAILGFSAASEINSRLLELGAKAVVPVNEAAINRKWAEENFIVDLIFVEFMCDLPSSKKDTLLEYLCHDQWLKRVNEDTFLNKTFVGTVCIAHATS